MNQNKPKILYIITQGHWGGAQKYVYNLASALSNSFEVVVAIGEPNNNPDLQRLLKDKGIEHIQLKHLRRSISPIADLLAIFELKKLYKKIKPNIIHLNSSKASILGSLASYKLQATSHKLLYTVHGWVFNEPMSRFKKNLYKSLEKWTAKNKSKIIVLSENEKNIAIRELKIKNEKLEIIPIGIELPKNILSKKEAQQEIFRLCPAPLEIAKNNNPFVIGTIANFYPTKNLDNLIKAIAKIKEQLNNFYLILVGDGPEKTKLEGLVKKYNLEKNIHMPGFLENAEQYLPAFDLFVLPSKKEGLPYTILEAKINGIPIIATNVGAISTIIKNKKTGLLVEPENTDKLGEALVYAYKHQTEMQNMAQEAKKESPNKNLQKEMIEKTTHLYK